MSLIKFIFFVVLVYLIYRTGQNLLQAALTDSRDRPRRKRTPEKKKKSSGPSYRAPHEEVEDAKWEDIS